MNKNSCTELEIISSKDVEYLTNIFDLNYFMIKIINDNLLKNKDQEMIELLMEIKGIHKKNINLIINLLNEDGEIYE